MWHQTLPGPKTELELGELLSGEQTPVGHVRVGLGPTWPIFQESWKNHPTPTQTLASLVSLPAHSTITFSGKGWMAPVCWPTSHLIWDRGKCGGGEKVLGDQGGGREVGWRGLSVLS